MRKLFLIVFIACLIACNEKAENTTTATTDSSGAMSSEKMSYPYPILYSADFEMGKPENGKMILDLWKDWDNNTLDNSTAHFADSVTMYFPGSMMAGPRDSVMAGAKQYRGQFKEVTSSVSTVLPVRSKDKNEDWVLVWGKEISVDNNNKVDSVYLQETWRINKEGKIDLLYQYKAAPATNK